MTELQEKQFEILKCFIDICDKMNLTYYMVCGSALGAVKYNGFIPWDDDVDVAMPREDYRVFVEKAQKMLPENIFVQTYKTDREFPQIFCKLRDSDTTFIEESAKNLNINHGVFIDVFPLDGYPENKFQQRIFEFRKRIYQSELLSAYQFERKGKSKILYQIYDMMGVSRRTAQIAEKYEKMISSYPVKTSKVICNHGNWQGKLEYAPKGQYSKGLEIEFEKVKVRVPEQYDAYLRQKYGDYTKELPQEEQKGHHYYTICDLRRSYKLYQTYDSIFRKDNINKKI